MTDDLKIAFEAYRIAVLEEHNASEYGNSIRKPMPQKITDEFRHQLHLSNQRYGKAHDLLDKASGNLNRIIIKEAKE